VLRAARAYVETPEFDPLHDQGCDYARALVERGVEVESNEITGGIHGFDILVANGSLALDAMQRRIRFLQRIFGQSPAGQ
jgi:acetyl esterase/lipase